MEKINQLRGKTLSLLQAAIDLAKEHQLQEKGKKLEGFVNRLKRGRTIVVVCGEFKRGKSSFVNALLEEYGLCPVDIDITTNMATQIQYTETEQVRVHFQKESGKPPIDVSRGDMPMYVTEQENTENRENVQLVELGIVNERLKKNLMVVVDTPGVGSLNEKHSEVTAAYLSVADVLIFVTDSLAPLTTAELDFIKRAGRFCRNIYFVITKIDMVRDGKAIEEENRKKLSEYLGSPPEKLRIFPVSNRSKIDYVKTGDTESLEDSRFTILEECLFKDLNTSIAKNLLLTPLVEARADADTVKKSLTLQMQAVKQGNTEKKKEIEDKLAELNEKYKSIQKSNSKWQMILNDNSAEIKKQFNRILKSGFNELEKEIKEKLKDSGFRENADNINAYIKSSIIEIMRETNTEIDGQLAETQKKIMDEIGQEIEIDFEIGDEDQDNIIELNAASIEDKRTKGEKFRDLGRTLVTNQTAFGAGTAVIGAGVGAAIAIATGAGAFIIPVALAWAKLGGGVGVGIGALFGFKSHSKEIAKRQEAEVLKSCLEVIRDNRVAAIENMDIEFGRLISQIKSNIYDSIQESMEVIDKTRNEIGKNLNSNASDIARETQKLQEAVNKAASLCSDINNTIVEVQKI